MGTFAAHQDIAHALKTKIFFATPYHAWERGLNENTNALRDFFPKGTGFSTISSTEVAKVERLLNARPRKSLGFRSPQRGFPLPRLLLNFCAGKLNPRNLIADPSGLYDLIAVTGLNTLRTRAGSRPHLSKLAMACREKPEAVVIGTSRIRIGIDPRHPGWGTAAGRVYNLGIPGIGLQEAALTLQHAVYASGRLRLAVVGLDFLMFNANHEAFAPETGKVTFDRQRYVVSASGSCAGSFIQ